MLEFAGCRAVLDAFELTVDWTLPEAARLAVIGPSGSGKSTLLGLVSGFVAPVAGEVRWQGKPLPPRPDARPVAMLFQDHNLFPHLTVGQNVGLGLRPALRLHADEVQKVETALQNVGLDGMADRKPAELSGGQQSRVALARVSVMNRPLVLLDEPFSALGPGQRMQMLDLVAQVALAQNAALIMVTHDPEEAKRLDGAISFVAGGRAQPPVPADRFFAHPPQGYSEYIGEKQGQ